MLPQPGSDPELACELERTRANLGGQHESAGDAIGMQDVVQDVEVVQEREVLEDEADAEDPEPPPFAVG